MDILKIYYYTSIPILTCNLLFYSITALSTSITSSQNVVKFISEHKDCDSIVFKHELESIDLENKLRIIESLIFDIIKKYCKTKEEFDEIKNNIKSPNITCNYQDETNQFEIIELKNKISVLERIDEPIRYALLSTSDIIQIINNIIIKIYEKIKNHNVSYLNKFVNLSLQNELFEFKKKCPVIGITI